MLIGVPKELKNHEYRVAITPPGVHELTELGHRVLVEHDAGAGSSLPDAEYTAAGATILERADELWADAELVLKVKEPVPAEFHRLRAGQVLFTYLHLAAAKACAEALLAAGTTAIAYETVRGKDGGRPLLAPMSEVAGRLAPQVGAAHLLAPAGGRGVLLGGVPGVAPADVVVIGAGVAGGSAVATAVGLGASVTVFDLDLATLRRLDERHGGRVRTRYASALDVRAAVTEADLVIGAVLVPGARAPKVVSHETVTGMRPGSVLVDIAIDQGGCFADSRPTTHAEPTYRVAGSLFYCVPNMPGAAPRTSTFALTNATLPYAVALAERGVQGACQDDPGLAAGLCAHRGALTDRALAADLELPHAHVQPLAAA